MNRETVSIAHADGAALARGATRAFARALGWSEAATEEFVICASEVAQNIVDHGGQRGIVTLEAPEGGAWARLEATDFGPGLDPGAALLARTEFGGEGLAALGRLMDSVDLAVRRGAGLRVSALKWLAGRAGPSFPKVVVMHRPHPRETQCGDAALVERGSASLRVAVVDGLGHGDAAREAALAGCRSLAGTLDRDPAASLSLAHGALLGTRGAAASVADLGVAQRQLRVSGVGNVRVTHFGRDGRRWTSSSVDAVLGQPRPGGGPLRPRLESVQWHEDDLLVLHSDGISSRLALDGTVGVARANLVRTAMTLFARHVSGSDDATLVLVGL